MACNAAKMCEYVQVTVNIKRLELIVCNKINLFNFEMFKCMLAVLNSSRQITYTHCDEKEGHTR